jgi:hypothetical protein
MPRAKRPKMRHNKTCLVCRGKFQCLRADKITCGEVCRKRLSRKVMDSKKSKRPDHGLKAGSEFTCSDCGCELDGRAARCPVCGVTLNKKVKK